MLHSAGLLWSYKRCPPGQRLDLSSPCKQGLFGGRSEKLPYALWSLLVHFRAIFLEAQEIRSFHSGPGLGLPEVTPSSRPGALRSAGKVACPPGETAQASGRAPNLTWAGWRTHLWNGLLSALSLWWQAEEPTPSCPGGHPRRHHEHSSSSWRRVRIWQRHLVAKRGQEQVSRLLHLQGWYSQRHVTQRKELKYWKASLAWSNFFYQSHKYT